MATISTKKPNRIDPLILFAALGLLMFALWILSGCNKAEVLNNEYMIANQRQDTIMFQCNGTGFKIPPDTAIYRKDGNGSMRFWGKPWVATSIKNKQLLPETKQEGVVTSANFIEPIKP